MQLLQDPGLSFLLHAPSVAVIVGMHLRTVRSLKSCPDLLLPQKDLITFQPPSQVFHLHKLLLMKNIVDTIPSLSYQKATAPNFPSIPSYHDSLCPGGNLYSVSNHLPVSVLVFIRILQLKNSNPQSLICCLVTIISLLLYEHLKIYSY